METNWRRVFKKYVGIVGCNEGVDFLYKNEWTNEDWNAIVELLHLECNDSLECLEMSNPLEKYCTRCGRFLRKEQLYKLIAAFVERTNNPQLTEEVK